MSAKSSQKILLTGATGFLGRHTRPVLEEHYGAGTVTAVGSAHFDLMNPVQVQDMLAEIQPDVVVHYAAYSGGIGANKRFPADFYYRNTVLTALMFDAAAKRGVRKFIYPMGGCSYPADAISPIDESQLFRGYPQVESAGYSTAKMMGVVAAESYREQYGMESCVLIPGNLYGEYDNFRLDESHVVPAMLRRYHEANLGAAESVLMWGTGSPTRDFTYAGDVARLIPFFIDNFAEVGPINVCTSTSTSIRSLAELIADLVDFKGEILWDASKPDGQANKIFSNSKIQSLGLTCPTSLESGLERTAKWFTLNYKNRTDGLRL